MSYCSKQSRFISKLHRCQYSVKDEDKLARCPRLLEFIQTCTRVMRTSLRFGICYYSNHYRNEYDNAGLFHLMSSRVNFVLRQ